MKANGFKNQMMPLIERDWEFQFCFSRQQTHLHYCGRYALLLLGILLDVMGFFAGCGGYAMLWWVSLRNLVDMQYALLRWISMLDVVGFLRDLVDAHYCGGQYA